MSSMLNPPENIVHVYTQLINQHFNIDRLLADITSNNIFVIVIYLPRILSLIFYFTSTFCLFIQTEIAVFPHHLEGLQDGYIQLS